MKNKKLLLFVFIATVVVPFVALSVPTPWEIFTAVYSGRSYSVATQTGGPDDVFFRKDGTKMYVLDSSAARIHEYSLTAWDISTATYNDYLNYANNDANPRGMYFRGDGVKLYVVGVAGDDVEEWTLGTAWDVSTAVYVQERQVTTEDLDPQDVKFSEDGTKMYMLGGVGDDVNQYNLSTAWNVSTASYSQSFSVTSKESDPRGMFFSPNGKRMFVVGSVSDAVHQYNLSTAWNIATATFYGTFFVYFEETFPNGVFFKENGDIMYIIGYDADRVFEYDLTTTSCTCAGFNKNWTITTGDACVITEICNLGNGVLTISGSGAATLNTEMYLQRMNPPATGQTINIGASALLHMGVYCEYNCW